MESDERMPSGLAPLQDALLALKRAVIDRELAENELTLTRRGREAVVLESDYRDFSADNIPEPYVQPISYLRRGIVLFSRWVRMTTQ